MKQMRGYLLAEKEFDDGVAQFVGRSFLVGDIQRIHRLDLTLWNLFPSHLDRNSIALLDHRGLGTFKDISVLVPLLNEFVQIIVIAIDPDFFDLGAKKFCQALDGEHVLGNRGQEDRPLGDLRSDFGSTKVVLTDVSELDQFSRQIPQREACD
jgi:hypothetical protein